MDTRLTDFYIEHEDIKHRYETAKMHGFEEAMEEAIALHRDLKRRIQAQSHGFTRVYDLYSKAKDLGNSHIDLCDVRDYENLPVLLFLFREFGIETFTFSSGWTSAVDVCWSFLQNGCTLLGMVQVNSPNKAFLSMEYEKRNAFLFHVEEV